MKGFGLLSRGAFCGNEQKCFKSNSLFSWFSKAVRNPLIKADRLLTSNFETEIPNLPKPPAEYRKYPKFAQFLSSREAAEIDVSRGSHA